MVTCPSRPSLFSCGRIKQVRNAKTDGDALQVPTCAGRPSPMPHGWGALGAPIVVPLRSASPAEVMAMTRGDTPVHVCFRGNLDVR